MHIHLCDTAVWFTDDGDDPRPVVGQRALLLRLLVLWPHQRVTAPLACHVLGIKKRSVPVYVNSLRGDLGVPDLVLSQNGQMAFLGDRESTDAAEFKSLVEDALELARGDDYRSLDHERAIRIESILEDAIAIWNGSPATGLDEVEEPEPNTLVRPEISGVAFSCDPVSLDDDKVAISWTYGLGDSLVSGESATDSDLLVSTDSATVLSGNWVLGHSLLAELVDLLRTLATRLGCPVDVEWCVRRGDRKLTLLQVRPLALPSPSVVGLDSLDHFDSLPGQVKSHPKMQLRRQAIELGVPMSRARAVIATRPGGLPDLPPFAITHQSAGRSVVLLHPNRVEGRVVREFARDCSTDVEFFVRGCQRYSIRQYPNAVDARHTVISTLETGLHEGLLACVIEQEIYHAYATGIVRATSDGVIMEIALGHFIPKGYVETSEYVLDHNGDVVHEATAIQHKAYHFLNGHVIVEQPPYEPLALTHADVRGIVKDLSPMLTQRPDAALEFGVTGSSGALNAYMIDVADSDQEAHSLTSGAIARGIISPGVASGQIVDLRHGETFEDLNAHLHNAQQEKGSIKGPVVYIAKRASIDLLPLARSCHPGSGFIFEQGSVLAHLPVVLRELGLAALVMKPSRIESLLAGGIVRIDTASEDSSQATVDTVR